MELEESLDEQIRANLAAVKASSQFVGDRVWLTFYLSGPPENLQMISEALADSGWVNTDGWEGAFLYPKLEADLTPAAIAKLAHAVRALCERHEVQILNIDADTSPDVNRSRFVTLYRS